MVCAGHNLATAAGYRILEEGGNAIDAGVAAGIAINVVLPENTNFGGVAPIMVYLAETNSIGPSAVWVAGRAPHQSITSTKNTTATCP